MRVSVRSEKNFRKDRILSVDQPVHLMMESQGMEYLVLDFPPGLLFFFIQTISMEVDRLGSSLSPDRSPTSRRDPREAEHENKRIFSRSQITTH